MQTEIHSLSSSSSTLSMKRSQPNFHNLDELEGMWGTDCEVPGGGASTKPETSTTVDATKPIRTMSSITTTDSYGLHSSCCSSYRSFQNYQSTHMNPYATNSCEVSYVSCSCDGTTIVRSDYYDEEDEERRDDDNTDSNLGCREIVQTEFLPILYYDPENAVYSSQPPSSPSTAGSTEYSRTMDVKDMASRYSSYSSIVLSHAPTQSQSSFFPMSMEGTSCHIHCIEHDETMNVIGEDDDDEWGQFVDLAPSGVFKRNRIVSGSQHEDDLFALVMEF